MISSIYSLSEAPRKKKRRQPARLKRLTEGKPDFAEAEEKGAEDPSSKAWMFWNGRFIRELYLGNIG